MNSRTNIKETTNQRGGVSSLIQAKPWADVSETRCLLFPYTHQPLAYTQSSLSSDPQDEQVIVTRETTGGKTLSFKQVTGNYILTKQRAT